MEIIIAILLFLILAVVAPTLTDDFLSCVGKLISIAGMLLLGALVLMTTAVIGIGIYQLASEMGIIFTFGVGVVIVGIYWLNKKFPDTPPNLSEQDRQHLDRMRNKSKGIMHLPSIQGSHDQNFKENKPDDK